MSQRLQALIGLFFGCFTFASSSVLANASDAPGKLVLTASALTEREVLLLVAQEYGLFRKFGLDVQVVQVRSGPLAIAALSSGDSHLHWGSVTGANLGAIVAGADLVFVGGFVNRLTGTLVVAPQIRTPLDLKGKTLGVNTISGGGGIFTSLVLEHWGLIAERDRIQLRALGGDQSVIAQNLIRGGVDGAYFSHSYGRILQANGFHILAEFDKLGIAYQGSGVICRSKFATSSPGTIESVLRSLVESANFVRAPDNKPAVLRSLIRGLRIARSEDAESAYGQIVNLFERRPYPSIEGIRNAIRIIARNQPEVGRLRPEDLVVDRFIRKLERDGRL